MMKMNPSLLAAIIILIGGITTAFGVFLAARQAIKDGNELNQKNEEIARLSQENAQLSKQALDQITGGSSWAFIKSGLEGVKGLPNQSAIWTINIVGEIPIYDVSLTVYEVTLERTSPTKAYDLKTILSKNLGTITPSLQPDQIGIINLPKQKKRADLLVKIKARNGEITQHIILIQEKESYWSFAEKIFRYKPQDDGSFSREILRERINEGFPESEIEWLDM